MSRSKYNKRYLGIVKLKNTEKVSVFEKGILVGTIGDSKKRIKADICKIDYLNKRLWK